MNTVLFLLELVLVVVRKLPDSVPQAARSVWQPKIFFTGDKYGCTRQEILFETHWRIETVKYKFLFSCVFLLEMGHQNLEILKQKAILYSGVP
jgi:hypothetical protein